MNVGGFQHRRFHLGIEVIRLPGLAEFDLAAYSMTAEHRYKAPTDLDLTKLKKMAAGSWALTGPERLVKVRPVVPHVKGMNPDDQYPPGRGAPQWRLTARLQGTVVAIVNGYPDGVYHSAP
jgi:hypothetical protein